MAARAYWKGYLKLSLVSCPIALNPATSTSERVSFRQINKKTGHRLRQQMVDDETREPVPAEDRGKGYEVAKNEYLLVEDEELEVLEVESSHTIDIDRFVPAAQIDKRYYDSPYYIVPNDKVGQEAFAVIRDVMKGKGMVALGRVVMAKRERVIALEPMGKGLIGTTLRYPYEVRNADDYFSDIADIEVSDEMLDLATHILETKAADFDPSQFKDRYEEALVELIRKKQAHIPIKPAKEQPEAPRNVISLMDALRRSIQSERGGEAPAAGGAKKGRKRIEGQKEMLLPIAGKREGAKTAAAKETGKEAARKPARAGAKQRKAG
ncbi:MAG: Ku protein [Hyphomicrobiales bacterium]|nr:Ku protein [Hyphomicrobiales bacterium]